MMICVIGKRGNTPWPGGAGDMGWRKMLGCIVETRIQWRLGRAPERGGRIAAESAKGADFFTHGLFVIPSRASLSAAYVLMVYCSRRGFEWPWEPWTTPCGRPWHTSAREVATAPIDPNLRRASDMRDDVAGLSFPLMWGETCSWFVAPRPFPSRSRRRRG